MTDNQFLTWQSIHYLTLMMISLQIDVKTSIANANNDFYLDNSCLIKIGQTVTLEITGKLKAVRQ